MKSVYKLLISCLVFFCSIPVGDAISDPVSDSIAIRFSRQLQVYPQEKIYLQTDKPYYIGGEDLWFRVFLTDYTSHVPDTTSRYVYIELINPQNVVIKRIKTIPRDAAYYGYIHLDEVLPEGVYQMRSYTRYMAGMEDACLFRKQVYIGGALSATYRTNSSFDFESNGKKVRIRLRLVDINTNELILPKEFRYIDKDETVKIARASADSIIRISCNPEKDLINRVLYIEYDYLGRSHRQYVNIPYPEDEYDVAFLPEGGNFPAETSARIAFKALGADGLGEAIAGSVVDSTGKERGAFRSNLLGMGSFYLKARSGERLYAKCKNVNGVEKRFELPVAELNVLTLQAQWTGKVLNLFVTRESDKTIPSDLYLLLQCRGALLYSRPWDSKQKYLQLKNEELPSGVIQALLVDAGLNPVSERLIFNINKAERSEVRIDNNRSTYSKRELIRSEMHLTDWEQNPLSGDFSVSVTADKDVLPDSSNTLLTTMLLTSELKGYVENPGWYFSETNPQGFHELDLLMLTQGWSRYCVANILKDCPDQPKGILEIGPEISGVVGSGLGYMQRKAGHQVSLTSFIPSSYEMTETDNNGRFRFLHTEMPDSTRFLIQTLTRKGKKRLELMLDSIPYPAINYRAPALIDKKHQLESYMKAAEDRYTKENGIRTIYLDEVIIKAGKKGKSPLTVDDSRKITLKRIENTSAATLFILLKSIGDLIVKQDNISWTKGCSPAIIIDEMIFDEMDFIINMSKDLIEEIELVKPGPGLARLIGMFGSEVICGALLITTKARDGGFPQRKDTNKKSIVPLGYQREKEFYSPQYQTEEDRRKVPFDLRTTLYWNPSIKISAGKAKFDFYSADLQGSYTITLEGITTDGKLIRKTHKINIKK